MEKNKPAHLSLLYDHCLVTQHGWVELKQKIIEAEMKATLGEGGTSPLFFFLKKTEGEKETDPRQRGQGLKSLHEEPLACTRLDVCPGDLGRGPSHQSTCSNIETRMDRPKSVVRVIKGVT